MGLEVAEFVQDFVDTNPISGDDINQGDNHIRMIKETLKRTFPGATKAMYASITSAKVASFSVVAADENTMFMVDATAGAVVATLPTLTAGDHGWTCYFMKMDAVNTFHIIPASGSVYSGPALVTKARRCIPAVKFGALWSGSNWLIERCERAPVGVSLPFQGATLPTGYEWPSGQTLASASTNYQEFYAANGNSGVTFDLRGRAPFGKSNMGGSDSGLISSITGTTLGSTGGAQTVTLAQANLPSVNFTCSGFSFTGSGSGTLVTYGALATGYNLSHGHGGRITGSFSALYGFGAGTGLTNSSTTELNAIDASGALDHAHYFAFTPAGTVNAGSAASGGSGTAVNKLPPAIVMNFILVVE